jgi:hypothetical protein
MQTALYVVLGTGAGFALFMISFRIFMGLVLPLDSEV